MTVIVTTSIVKEVRLETNFGYYTVNMQYDSEFGEWTASLPLDGSGKTEAQAIKDLQDQLNKFSAMLAEVLPKLIDNNSTSK